MNQELNEIVAEILDLEIEDITDTLSMESAESWDSLNHLRIMTAVEEEFKIKLSMKEIESIKDLARLRQVLALYVQTG